MISALYGMLALCLSGLVLSSYAYVAGKEKKKRFCDIRNNVSCTRAFTSRYSRLAVLPNSLWGVIFYLGYALLALLGFSGTTVLLSLLAFLGTVCLAYLSYIKMRNFCLVCTAMYLINILLLLTSVYWYFF